MIELLAVMAVIAILAALVVGGTRLAFRKGQEAAIRAKMKKMELALDQYRRDWGYYPIQQTVNVMDLSFDLKSPAGVSYLEEDTKPYRLGGAGSMAFKYRYPGATKWRCNACGWVRFTYSGCLPADAPGSCENANCPTNAPSAPPPDYEPLLIDCSPDRYDLWSWGVDKTRDNKDDITNWGSN